MILEYQNSPLPDCIFSPAQLLLSRRTRSTVPITNKLLKLQAIDPKNVQKSIFRSKSLQKKNYDRTAKTLSPLHVNDQVRIQFGKIWKPARVIEQHDARSFSVQTHDGAIYRRNRRHLTRTQINTPRVEPFNPNVLAPKHQHHFLLTRLSQLCHKAIIQILCHSNDHPICHISQGLGVK